MLHFYRTERGFLRADFQDTYEQHCSLQKSSSAEVDAIWFGVDKTGPRIKGPNLETNEVIHARMHLTREQVAALLPALERFVETGELQ